MTTRVLFFLSILLTAVAMAAGMAHLFALPNKIQLPAADYLTVQQVYRGWALLGFPIFAALLSAAALTLSLRSQGAPMLLELTATVSIAASLVIFFSFTYPVNQATQNWTVLPENWEHLRRQWEYSHVAGALLYLVALASLVLSAVSRR